MKKIILAFAIGGISFLQAQNYEVSTLRIGDFKIFMEKNEADRITGTTLSNDLDFDKPNRVKYYGDVIEIILASRYISEEKPSVKSIYHISTKSRKFRTRSGVGVGSTREDLLNTYKNYANFSVHQYKDDNKKPNVDSFFTLHDYDAGTFLTFKLKDNVVEEIMVGMDEGC